MTNKEFPDINFPENKSEEIDLSKSHNFQAEEATTQEIRSSIGEAAVSAVDKTNNDFLDEELEIPKFLLKNNTEDAALFEEDKFVNRSMKMVQEAVKTLSEDQSAPVVGVAELNSSNNSTGSTPPSPKGSSWKLPTSIAAAVVAAGALFTYQNGGIEYFTGTTQNAETPQTLIASGYGSNGQSAINLKDTDGSSSSNWGAVASENEEQLPDVANENTTDPVTLSTDQYKSLKARLNSAPVIVANTPKKPTPVTEVVNTGQKRLQIAALVAEQAPPRPKSTRSLDQVNADAKELETDTDNTVASIKAAQPLTPVIVTPVKPVVIAPIIPVVKAKPVIKFAQTASAADNKLKLLTNNVVKQLTRLKKFEENPETADIPETQDLRNSINQLVQQATSQNLDSTAIEGLLQEALENSNAVPQALARSDGKLDTRLLLKSVLSQIDSSQVKSGDAAYLSALDDEGSSTVIRTSLATIEAASSEENARIKTSNGRKTFKVEIGDTLSKIAFAVYGDALTYTRIFKANRKQLKNPNLLTVGMVLVLP